MELGCCEIGGLEARMGALQETSRVILFGGHSIHCGKRIILCKTPTT